MPPASRPAGELPAGDWPADGLEAVGACPVCGATARELLHAGLRDRVFRSAPGTWTLVRCASCRSAYLDPRPSEATIGLAYRSYYTHHGAAHQAAPEPSGLRRALANDHLHARWGYERRPIAPGGRLIARAAPLRGAIVDREVRHLPAVPGGRLLDIGCGDGAFVAQMERLGWDAEGVDPDEQAVQSARRRGLRVTHGTVRDLDDDAHAGAYDAVTLSHVIEHLHDPADTLARIHRLLRPGGRVWIATPNLESLGHRGFGVRWLGLDPPRHLVLFTAEGLIGLLRRTGFVPEPVVAPWPQAWLSYSQSGALRDGRRVGEGPARGVRRLRLTAAVVDRLARRQPRLADELVVIARRFG